MTTEPKSAQEKDERAAREHCEELLDEMVEESFPGSDPPSTWAGPDEAGR